MGASGGGLDWISVNARTRPMRYNCIWWIWRKKRNLYILTPFLSKSPIYWLAAYPTSFTFILSPSFAPTISSTLPPLSPPHSPLFIQYSTQSPPSDPQLFLPSQHKIIYWRCRRRGTVSNMDPSRHPLFRHGLCFVDEAEFYCTG